MNEEKILFTTSLSSVIQNNEICDELVKLSIREGYPIKKAKLQKSLGKFVGFSKEHMITATKRPPIPGGWIIEIYSFTPGYHEMLAPVRSIIDETGKESGQINKFVLQMLEEYRKEGLEIEVAEEYEKVYGSLAKKIKAWGHPLLLDNLDEFVENMR